MPEIRFLGPQLDRLRVDELPDATITASRAPTIGNTLAAIGGALASDADSIASAARGAGSRVLGGVQRIVDALTLKQPEPWIVPPPAEDPWIVPPPALDQLPDVVITGSAPSARSNNYGDSYRQSPMPRSGTRIAPAPRRPNAPAAPAAGGNLFAFDPFAPDVLSGPHVSASSPPRGPTQAPASGPRLPSNFARGSRGQPPKPPARVTSAPRGPLLDFAPPYDYRPPPQGPRYGTGTQSPPPDGTGNLDRNTNPPPPTLPFESTSEKGPCKCPPVDQDGKEKKKKKRKERAVCYQGTYTQRKKGIKYAPRRMIPCEGEIEPEKAAKPKPRRPRKQPTVGDLARDIFSPL